MTYLDEYLLKQIEEEMNHLPMDSTTYEILEVEAERRLECANVGQERNKMTEIETLQIAIDSCPVCKDGENLCETCLKDLSLIEARLNNNEQAHHSGAACLAIRAERQN